MRIGGNDMVENWGFGEKWAAQFWFLAVGGVL
jgi:hypothetical protein